MLLRRFNHSLKQQSKSAQSANEITVSDSKGIRVDDGSIQIQGSVLMVGVKPLTISGLYTVAYTLMAIDQPPITGKVLSAKVIGAPSTIPIGAIMPSTICDNI